MNWKFWKKKPVEKPEYIQELEKMFREPEIWDMGGNYKGGHQYVIVHIQSSAELWVANGYYALDWDGSKKFPKIPEKWRCYLWNILEENVLDVKHREYWEQERKERELGLEFLKTCNREAFGE